MSYIVPKRVYKTADGRLTHESDPDAAFLAFPAGFELSDMEADRLGVRAYCEQPVTPTVVVTESTTVTVEDEPKMAAVAANKMRKTPTANKTPVGGSVATISTTEV